MGLQGSLEIVNQHYSFEYQGYFIVKCSVDIVYIIIHRVFHQAFSEIKLK